MYRFSCTVSDILFRFLMKFESYRPFWKKIIKFKRKSFQWEAQLLHVDRWTDRQTDVNSTPPCFLFEILRTGRKITFLLTHLRLGLPSDLSNFRHQTPLPPKHHPITPTLVTYPTNLITRTTFGEEKALKQQSFDLFPHIRRKPNVSEKS